MSAATPFFKADDIAINFGGIRAVDGVSFEVEPGRSTEVELDAKKKPKQSRSD